MRSMIRNASTLLMVLAFSTATARAEDPIIIKLSHVVTGNTAKGKSAIRFKELAEEKTKGRVKVEVYPNSTLYKDKEEIEALQLGAVHILIPAVAKFAPLGLDDFNAFDLPFLFPNVDALHRVTGGKIGQALLKKLNSHGIEGLAFWDNSFALFSANRPLKTPGDLKGLKMRSYSKIIDAQYAALGALPQSMAFSELYSALQTGVVDGQDTVPVNMVTQKLYEVQKHATLTFHRHPVYAFITNKKWWDGLNPDIQQSLKEAIAEATSFNNDIAQKENADALVEMRAKSTIQLYEPTADEIQVWRKALDPVFERAAARYPKDLIESIREEIKGGK